MGCGLGREQVSGDTVTCTGTSTRVLNIISTEGCCSTYDIFPFFVQSLGYYLLTVSIGSCSRQLRGEGDLFR